LALSCRSVGTQSGRLQCTTRHSRYGAALGTERQLLSRAGSVQHQPGHRHQQRQSALTIAHTQSPHAATPPYLAQERAATRLGHTSHQQRAPPSLACTPAHVYGAAPVSKSTAAPSPTAWHHEDAPPPRPRGTPTCCHQTHLSKVRRPRSSMTFVHH
jgi:hypothetical protein